MSRIRAFLLGVRESGLTITTRVEGRGERAYEYGRRVAQRLAGRASS